MFSRKQKTIFGLVLFLFNLLMFFTLYSGGASAYVAENNDTILNSSYTFRDRQTIVGTFGGQTVTFIDSTPDDTDYNYLPNGSNRPSDSTFCASGNTIAGITLNGNAPFASRPITANINLDYFVPNRVNGCTDTNPNSITKTISNPDVGQQGRYRWDGAELVSLMDGSRLSEFRPNIYVEDENDQCAGGRVVFVSGNTATEYLLLSSRTGVYNRDATEFPQLNNLLNINPEDCFASQSTVQISGTKGAQATAACTAGDPGCTCTGEGASQTCTTTADEPSCERSFTDGLEWILCGVLNTIDRVTQAMNGFIEDQLNFNVDENLNDNVEKIWSTMRILASSILLIVALIMVISQAISWGPFDAYTVRKLLPRLIVAIILMQLSWELGKFIIEIANNAGRGVADIMYAPFGGANDVLISDSFANLGLANGQLDAGATLLGLLIVGGGAAVILGPFGLILLAFSMLVAIFTAVIVLLFRKILIIFCMIFAPIALVLWILPGTQKYWNLWWETFIKLLIMFPLIMALIASGRIFGTIASQAGGNTLLNLFAVIVGFYGVYFILPKTFQWGGRALGNIAGVVNNQKGMFEKPKKLLGERKTQYKEYKADQAHNRIETGQYGRFARTRGMFDRAKTGRLDPTLLGPGMDQQRRNKRLEGAQKAAAFRLRDQTFDAQLATVDAVERKKLQENSDMRVAGMVADGSATTDELVRMVRQGHEEGGSITDANAAMEQLVRSRQFGRIHEEGLDRDTALPGGGVMNPVRSMLAVKPEHHGTFAEGRADMSMGNIGRGAAHTLGGGDLDPDSGQARAGLGVGQMHTQHPSLYLDAATEFEEAGRHDPITLENATALQGAVDRIQTLAASQHGRTIVGTEGEAGFNRILAEAHRRSGAAGDAPTYRNFLPEAPTPRIRPTT